MGCAETRDKTEEQGIQAFARMLKFHQLTIPEIKQVVQIFDAVCNYRLGFFPNK